MAKGQEETRGIVDKKALGRRIRAARVLAGIDSVEEFVARLAEVGCDVSARSMYGYERGEQSPGIDCLYAIVLVTNPRGGLGWLVEPALPVHVRQQLLAHAIEPEEGQDQPGAIA